MIDFNAVTSTWLEGGLPLPHDYFKPMLSTTVYSIGPDNEKRLYDVTFFVSNEQRIALDLANGVPEKDVADRSFPPFILAAHIRPKGADLSEARVYWTNLAEYGLSFLFQRIGVERDLQNGFDAL